MSTADLAHALGLLKLERIETIIVIEFETNGSLRVIGSTADGTTLEFIWADTYWI